MSSFGRGGSSGSMGRGASSSDMPSPQTDTNPFSRINYTLPAERTSVAGPQSSRSGMQNMRLQQAASYPVPQQEKIGTFDVGSGASVTLNPGISKGSVKFKMDF